jgi:hypothetical protein
MPSATKSVQEHLNEIHQRLDLLEHRIAALEELRTLLKGLGGVVADLKYQIEEMQEV